MTIRSIRKALRGRQLVLLVGGQEKRNGKIADVEAIRNAVKISVFEGLPIIIPFDLAETLVNESKCEYENSKHEQVVMTISEKEPSTIKKAWSKIFKN